MYTPSHRAERSQARGKYRTEPSFHTVDTGRRDLLKYGITVATVGATGLLIAEPAGAVGPGLRIQLDRRNYAPGEVARLTIRECVDYKRRILVSGPNDLMWRKVSGGRNRSVFEAKVETSGTITVHMKNRITDVRHESARVELLVASGQAVEGSASLLAYGATSFFQSRVAAAPVDADRTTAFESFMETHPDQKGITWPKITGTTSPSGKVNPWGTTFHLGTSFDPIWRLTGPGLRTETQALATQGFHMADDVADLIPTGTQDRPCIMNDPVFGYSAHFGDAVPNRADRTINVQASGMFFHSSNGLDRRNPHSTDDRNFSSRGRIIDSMVIRSDLVDAGVANDAGLGHVLQMFFVQTDARTFGTGFCHPMVGTEKRHIGGWGGEGERIAIRPDVDLLGRGLTGGALVIARTLQEHGCYIGDNSGSSSTLKGQQSSRTYNPYDGTNISVDCLKGKVTWDDFFVLPRGWQ